ncbi:MAG: asparagine synthetase B [Vicinamibacterales bacterium]
MSGLAALVHRDGHPAVTDDVAPLAACISTLRGRGRAARVHLSAEAALAVLPQVTGSGHATDGRVSVVLDGRLVERAALGAALDLPPADLAGTSDAALVLAAYTRWGEDAFARLTGTFAVAIWDAALRRLVCARDVLGGRPLFHAVDGNQVRVASSLAALAGPGTPINEGMVGEWLAGHPVHTTETVYAGVFRLPPAHLLVADPRQSRVSRYWTFDGFREIRYRSDEQYEQHFQDLFDRVVRDHLEVPPGQPAPGLMLSGGIDSGSVLASAAAQGLPLSAFTIGYDDPAVDETPVARAVLRQTGVSDWERVPPDTDFDPWAEARATWDIPSYPTGMVSAGLRRRAVERGIGAMLTGVGGDEWFFGSEWRAADMLVRGQWLAFLRNWRASVAMPASIGTAGVWRYALWPLVPPAGRELARRLFRRGGAVPPWIDAAWARRIDLADRLRLHRPPVAARSHAVRDHILSATDGAVVAAHDEQERVAARLGLEDRQPFMDRRIAEFALALPEDQRWRDGWPKSLLLRAGRTRLPDETRLRRDQPDYGFLVADTVERLDWRRRLRHSPLAERGWLRPQPLFEMAGAAGRIPVRAADRIWSAIAVQAWLDARERQGLPASTEAR